MSGFLLKLVLRRETREKWAAQNEGKRRVSHTLRQYQYILRWYTIFLFFSLHRLLRCPPKNLRTETEAKESFLISCLRQWWSFKDFSLLSLWYALSSFLLIPAPPPPPSSSHPLVVVGSLPAEKTFWLITFSVWGKILLLCHESNVLFSQSLSILYCFVQYSLIVDRLITKFFYFSFPGIFFSNDCFKNRLDSFKKAFIPALFRFSITIRLVYFIFSCISSLPFL